jgi:hypothetical protein
MIAAARILILGHATAALETQSHAVDLLQAPPHPAILVYQLRCVRF